MQVAYKVHVRYLYDGLKRHYAGPVCMSLDGLSLEEVVIQAFFDALRLAQLDALEALLAQQAKRAERLQQYHHDQVRLATNEAHLARRRYEAVDPDNRLVVASLERRWEETLLALRLAEEEAERVRSKQKLLPWTLRCVTNWNVLPRRSLSCGSRARSAMSTKSVYCAPSSAGSLQPVWRLTGSRSRSCGSAGIFRFPRLSHPFIGKRMRAIMRNLSNAWTS
jgi:hypothetical protein